MSTNRSTVPARLYKPSLPSADKAAVTAFGVGACPATQFKFDVSGRVASAGKTVRYEPDDGLMIATLIDTPVTPVGIVQFPLVPHTGTTNVSLGPIGVDLVPTLSGAGRVSNKRHGVIGTNNDAAAEPAADAVSSPPPPSSTVTTAPTAAQRDRPNMPTPIS
jgi:hypothetical protein